MAARLKNLDRESPMLFPPDLRDWIPENHIVHFLIGAVDQLPVEDFNINHRGTGDEQYPPRMMLCLLIYCYATGRFSSRVIEEATWSDVMVRYICGGDLHPDHDTICTFRRTNRELFEKAFVKVLLMAQEVAGLKKVGTVSVDGTKIKANASKHSAVSYKHAGEQIELLREEVKQLSAKAEKIDQVPLDDGLSVPDEIARREDRLKSLERARTVIESRYKKEREAKQSEYDAKMAKREQTRKEGKKPRGKDPQPPAQDPPDKKQYNFTDSESRIMKSGSGKHFEQAYNAQAAVDTDTYLIVGQLVTDAPNDKQQLNPVLESIPSEVINPENILADTGYYSEEAVLKAEANNGPTVYCAMAKSGHHISVAELEKQPHPEAPAFDAPMKEQMGYRLKTPKGKELYKLRKQTVEPVFGNIKENLGFRRFSMRGKEKVETEWSLICLTHNLKRIFKLKGTCAQKQPAAAVNQRISIILARISVHLAVYLKKTRNGQATSSKSCSVFSLNDLLTPTAC